MPELQLSGIHLSLMSSCQHSVSYLKLKDSESNQTVLTKALLPLFIPYLKVNHHPHSHTSQDPRLILNSSFPCSPPSNGPNFPTDFNSQISFLLVVSPFPQGSSLSLCQLRLSTLLTQTTQMCFYTFL